MKGNNSLPKWLEFLFLVIFLFLPCSVFASDDRSQLDVKLSLSSPLTPNSTATLTCILTSKIKAPNTNLTIELPNNISLVNGNLEWQGDISTNDTIKLSVKIKAIKTGICTISAKAKSTIDINTWLSDTDYLYLLIDLKKSIISKKVLFPKDWSPITPAIRIDTKDKQIIVKPFRGPKKPVPDSLIIFKKRDNNNSTSKGASAFKVSGYFYFYDPDGNLRPMRYSPIKISVIGYSVNTNTDQNGYFIFPLVYDFFGSNTVTLVAYSYNIVAEVFNPGTFGYYCSFHTFNLSPSVSSYDVGSIVVSQSASSPWWILDTLIDAWDFLANGPAKFVPATILIQYPRDEDGNGLAAFQQGKTWWFGWEEYCYIEIPNEASAANRSTVVHEYGHFIMYEKYGGWTPESDPIHYVNARSNKTTAWAEGWAEFFPLAVYNDPNYRGYNLELNYTWFDNGDEVEGRVASSLWDIFDSNNDGYDRFSDGFKNIWEVFASQPVSGFREFWNVWRSKGQNTHDAIACLYQNIIDYDRPPSFAPSSPRPVYLCTDSFSEAYKYQEDIRDHVNDSESPDEKLALSISNVSDSRVNAAIQDNAYLTVKPDVNWVGKSDVTVKASDGLKDASCKFRFEARHKELDLVSPNGGETFYIGHTVPIKWIYFCDPPNLINIFFSYNKGTDWNKIEANYNAMIDYPGNEDYYPNEGSYGWVIPYIPNSHSNECLMKIEGLQGNILDICDNTFIVTWEPLKFDKRLIADAAVLFWYRPVVHPEEYSIGPIEPIIFDHVPIQNSEILQGDPTRFSIYRGTNPNKPFNIIAQNIKEYFYIDKNVMSNKIYFYKVTSNNKSIETPSPLSVKYTKAHTTLLSKFVHNRVNIDGFIDKNEWKNATSSDIYDSENINFIRMYIMNNDSSIFIAIDDLNDKNLDSNNVYVFIDVDNDKRWSGGNLQDEGVFYLNFLSNPNERGNLSFETKFSSLAGDWPKVLNVWRPHNSPFKANIFPSSKVGHLQYEVRIDLLKNSLYTSAVDTIGFHLLLSSLREQKVKYSWPNGSISQAPFTFGEIVISPNKKQISE